MAGVGVILITLVWLLIIALGIVSAVCWIMMLVKAFQNDDTVIGVLGIFFQIVIFIVGWIKVNEWNAKKIMTIWTIATVLSIVLVIVLVILAFSFAAAAGPDGFNNNDFNFNDI